MGPNIRAPATGLAKLDIVDVRVGPLLEQRPEFMLRCVAQPDGAQAALLDRLWIILPKRMRLPENTSPLPARSA
jgi:hypothetical protein